MSAPTYQGVYNLRAIVRGDTVPSWSVTVARDGSNDDIVSARMHLVGPSGDVIVWPTAVSAKTVTMAAIPAETTAEMRVGVYRYDLEVTYPGGYRRTYLRGSLTIAQGWTNG